MVSGERLYKEAKANACQPMVGVASRFAGGVVYGELLRRIGSYVIALGQAWSKSFKGAIIQGNAAQAQIYIEVRDEAQARVWSHSTAAQRQRERSS